MATPFVSVIVPVYNDRERLLQCLSALGQQTYPADRVEIIVADNGSTDGSAEAAAATPGVRVVKDPSGGSYTARNAGVAVAKGEAVAFTDADCLPDREWLEQGLKALQAEPMAGLVAGRVVVFPITEPPPLVEAYEIAWAFDQQDAAEHRNYSATASAITWMRVIREVGPFRADMMGSGDVEWGHRVAAAGHRVVYAERCVVRHPARTTWLSVSRKFRRTMSDRFIIGHSPSIWFLVRRLTSIVGDPIRTLARSDLPLGVRWRAAIGSAWAAALKWWVLSLQTVLGRPTLRLASLKGW